MNDHVTIVDTLLRGNVLVLQAYLESTRTNTEPRKATIQVTSPMPHVYAQMPSSVDIQVWQNDANKTLHRLVINTPNTRVSAEAPIHSVVASSATLVVGRYHHDHHVRQLQCGGNTMYKVYLSDIAFYSNRLLAALDTFASSQGGRLYHTDWPVTLSLLCDLGCPIGFRSAAAIFGIFALPDEVGVGGIYTCECDYGSLRHALEVSSLHSRSRCSPPGDAAHLPATPLLSDNGSRGPNILVAGCVLGPNYRIEVYLYRVHWNDSRTGTRGSSAYTTVSTAWEGATSLAEFARWAGATSFDVLYHTRTGSGLKEANYTDEMDLEAVATRKTGGCICVSMARLLSHPALPVRPPLESVELCSLLAHPVIGPLLTDEGRGGDDTKTPHVWIRVEQTLRIVAGFQELALAMKISLASFLRSSTVKQCTNYLRHMLHSQMHVFDAGWLRTNVAATVRERMADSSFPPPTTTAHTLRDESPVTPGHFPRGGYFMSPVPGDTLGPVVKLDFSKFYPSIIQAFQLDFERLVPTDALTSHANREITFTRVPIAKNMSLCLLDPGLYAYSSTGGFLSSAMRQLGRIRDAHRRQALDAKARGDSLGEYVASTRETAMKLLTNSVYGLLSMPSGSVFFGRPLAEAITSIGRWILQRAILYAQTIPGVVVRAAATDSLDVELPYDAGNSLETNLCAADSLVRSLCSHVNSMVPPPLRLVQAEWLLGARYFAVKNMSFGLELPGGPFLRPDDTPEASSLANLRWSHLPMRSTGAPHTRRGVCALVRHACQDVMSNLARREPWHKCVLVIGSFVKTILFGGYKLSDSRLWRTTPRARLYAALSRKCRS